MSKPKTVERQFKFRIWDVVRKKMFPWEKAVNAAAEFTAEGGEVFHLHMLPLCFSDTKGKKLVAHQFTGILDSSGKEIYEGDIITFSVNELLVWPIFPVNAGYISFCDGMFVVNLIHKKQYPYSERCFPLISVSSIHVIGNMCEQPELPLILYGQRF